MMPSEIGRRHLQDHYFICTCGKAWKDCSYEVDYSDCLEQFAGSETEEPRGLCFICGKSKEDENGPREVTLEEYKKHQTKQEGLETDG